MKVTENGMMFDDVYELTYELLHTLDLIVRPDGTIFEPATNSVLSFNGMIIKATIKENDIKYAGEGEIVFDVLNNVRMITVLFGHYLEKKQAEGMPFVSYFSDEQMRTFIMGTGRGKHEEDVKFTNLTIKHDTYHSTNTKFYHNKNLKFIDAIFTLEEDNVDLSNFDPIDEEHI